MIQLMKKKLFPERMESLYECDRFTDEVIERDFEIHGGRWYAEDGWVVGENRECSAAMIMTRGEYVGDVLVEFDAATVAPATHDINVTWHGSWDYDKNARGMGYVMGVEGFWEGFIGFERSPDYSLLAMTDLFDFTPGEVYHITVGNIGSTLFMAINDRLALSVTDPAPIDVAKYGNVGFEAFCTKVKYRNLKIKKLEYVDDWKTYTPEF